jgi:hypothetical protein
LRRDGGHQDTQTQDETEKNKKPQDNPFFDFHQSMLNKEAPETNFQRENIANLSRSPIKLNTAQKW